MKNLIQTPKINRITNHSFQSTLAFVFAGLLAVSCSDGQKNTTEQAENVPMETTNDVVLNHDVIHQYMELKNALVNDDQDAASEASKKLESTLNDINLDSYTADEQNQLKEMIASSQEHIQSINNSDLDGQRQAFELLSGDMTQMIETAGTDLKVYQQFCPMYGGDGAVWLSTEEKVMNPYFGSKMINCGKVQKEFN